LTFDGAYCDPKPIQNLPELWIGGGGEKVTLKIEARHADKTNWQTGLDAFKRKSGLLEQYCDEIGRDFASITRTHGPDCRVFDCEADLKKWLDSPGGGSLWGRGDPVEYVRDNFVGTVEQVGEKVQGYVDAGCGEFVLWFRDYPESASLEAMINDVAPKIRA
jgi:alkanesulfonate monooxygenase SsuD/methylene tetrahydromethanopterin reductase-like flavin-dependent oxidoreductase (luciferase family)